MRTSKTLTALAAAAVLALTGCTAEPGEAESTSSTTAPEVQQVVLPVGLPDITKMYVYPRTGGGQTLWVVAAGGTEVLAPVTAEVTGASESGSHVGGGWVAVVTPTGERLLIAGVTPTVTEGDAAEQGAPLGVVQRLPEQSLRADGIAFEVRDADGLPLDPRTWLAGE